MTRKKKFFDEIQVEEDVMRLAAKWRKGILSLVFSRFSLVLILLLIEITVTFLAYSKLEQYLLTSYVNLRIVFIFGVMLYLINSTMDSTAKMTWMVVIAAVPFFGTVFYLWTNLELGHRKLGKRLERIIEKDRGMIKQNERVFYEILDKDPDSGSLSIYLNRSGSFPIFKDTDVKYFPLGEDKFKAMLEDLEKAESFIFLEYFIIEEGYMWGRILEILARKAAEGVEVRVMYDGTCVLSKVPMNYHERLQAVGIKAKLWGPMRFPLSTTYNFRDHRKILVIDGKVAYNGGVNLADEYINLNSPFGHWKDTAVRVEGPAVASYTLMFMEMWNADTLEPEPYEDYVQTPTIDHPEAKGFVIPYADSPLDEYKVGRMVYMDILHTAEDYVWIASPYLILDDELKLALQFAAERGTDVRIVLPGIPDKKIPWALAKSHYEELLTSGVKIYEYTPGFVHAKVFVSDDTKAVVGTINLDYRSLYHHFECATYMSRTPCVTEIRMDMYELFSKCKHITLKDVRNEKLWIKTTGYVLKAIAPML